MCTQSSDPPAGAPSLGQQALAALDEFLAVQQQRAQHYRRFDEGHRVYMRTKAEGPYRYLMTQLTPLFQLCSQQVMALEQRLAGPLGQPGAAALLRAVQEQEREKLELTLALHALRAAQAHGRFSWQQAGEEDAGGVGWPGHVCGINCNHGDNEPTKAEYDAAVKESYQNLQAAITAINEAIEEVRELRAELAEEGEQDGE